MAWRSSSANVSFPLPSIPSTRMKYGYILGFVEEVRSVVSVQDPAQEFLDVLGPMSSLKVLMECLVLGPGQIPQSFTPLVPRQVHHRVRVGRVDKPLRHSDGDASEHGTQIAVAQVLRAVGEALP